MSKKLVIIGAGGHGKVAADIASKNGYSEIVFLDDVSTAKECLGYPLVGKLNMADQFGDFDFFVAVGNPKIREEIMTELSYKGMKMATLIHPSAVLGKNVSVGEGTIIAAGAVINPDTVIGKGVIINTCSSVDHDCIVEDFVHVAVGSHLCGTVSVGSGTWIGAGATVSNNISICPDCMIGAGAVVVNDVQESGTYVCVPAKRIDMEEKSVKNAGVSRRIVYLKASVQLSKSRRAA